MYMSHRSKTHLYPQQLNLKNKNDCACVSRATPTRILLPLTTTTTCSNDLLTVFDLLIDYFVSNYCLIYY